MKKTTKFRIVENAEKLLWHQGYEATSLNEVVDRAGVSKGAFFHYYPNKQAISQDVIRKYAAEQLIEPLQISLAGSGTVKEALFQWVSGMFEKYKENDFKGGCLLGNLALELSDQNDHAREEIKQHFLDLENLIVSALRPVAKERKIILEPRQFARLFIASYQGVLMMVKVHKDNNRASREFQALFELIEYMIKD